MANTNVQGENVSHLSSPLLIAAVSAALTFALTMYSNYKNKQWDTASQIKLRELGDQRQIYGQIAGQKAVLLQLQSDLAFTSDAFVFYQASSAGLNGMAAAGKGKELSKTYADLGKSIADDAFQKERLLEHYHDQSLTVNQQMFSALGQARLLFPADQALDELIRKVEQLSDYDYRKPDPMEMLKHPDINTFLRERKERADAEIRRIYGQPLDNVLTYLKEKIDASSK